MKQAGAKFIGIWTDNRFLANKSFPLSSLKYRPSCCGPAR